MKKILYALVLLPIALFAGDVIIRSGGTGTVAIQGGGAATASSGSSGSSALEVFNNNDATRSSPTASIGLSNAFRGTVSGSSYTISVNFSSMTSREIFTTENLWGANQSNQYTFKNNTTTDWQIGDVVIAAGGTNGTNGQLQLRSDVGSGNIRLEDANNNLKPFEASTLVGSVAAENIAAGSLGSSVLASSVAASAFRAALSAGSNVTLTNTGDGVQIASSGGGVTVYPATSTIIASVGVSGSTFTFSSSGTVNGNFYVSPSSNSVSTTHNVYTETTVGGFSPTKYAYWHVWNPIDNGSLGTYKFRISSSSNTTRADTDPYVDFFTNEDDAFQRLTFGHGSSAVSIANSEGVSIVGPLVLDSSDGTAGQVVTSQGPGLTAVWADPTGGMTPGDTNYIQNTPDLQVDSIYHVSSGTVEGQFTVKDPDTASYVRTFHTGSPGESIVHAHAAEVGGVWGSYSIIVSTADTFSASNGSILSITPPNASGDGGLFFTSKNNGSVDFDIVGATTSIRGPVGLSNGVGEMGWVFTSAGDGTRPSWSAITGSVAGTTTSITTRLETAATVSGSTRCTTMTYAGTISSWTVISDVSATLSMHFSSSTYANYPTLSNMTGAGNKPSLSSTQKNSATVSGWTGTSFAAGTQVCAVVDSAATFGWADVVLWVIKQ